MSSTFLTIVAGGLADLEQDSYTNLLTLERGLRVSRARRTTALVNDEVIRNLSDELLRPQFGLDDAIRRFLRECSGRVGNIMANAINEFRQ
jgi:hypothetical protein